MLRRRLRTELRTARLDKGLTQEQVANAMTWSLSKMNRIEKIKTGITVNDVKALLPLYEISDREDELVAMAKAARQPPWWRGRYTKFAPPKLLDLIDYEYAATAISQFENTYVPGILQTEQYASAVLRDFYDADPGDERVAALVDLRTRRRDLLASDNAPKFTFILDEPVLHRMAGSPSVTRQQLEHLANAAKLPNVTMRIVPFTAGLHPGMKGPFEVVEFDDTPDENIVYVEEQAGAFIKDDPKETNKYLQAFKRITEKSLAPSDSVDNLLKASYSWDS
jgi:transcriptional regulator with XRE-family HTH domain